MYEMDVSEKAFKDIKKLVGLFPSSRKVLKLMRSQRNSEREMLFMKVTIDIMENYCKVVEKPLFAKLQGDVFPMALKFYSGLDERILNEMNDLLRLRVDKSILLIHPIGASEYFTICNDKKSYVQHYKNKAIQYEILTGGNTVETYFMCHLIIIITHNSLRAVSYTHLTLPTTPYV
eukprot:TRINITY_DN2638_c0_g1_i6.p1 TRINITY_DN2638_c0_g1~~TRINITY_DN2638_c0_g1_i6.p1  ORF type:complete len:176 (+),score=43.54 TRINITY_DN2638_c0_g1_i6:617-1144(+)